MAVLCSDQFLTVVFSQIKGIRREQHRIKIKLPLKYNSLMSSTMDNFSVLVKHYTGYLPLNTQVV